MAIILLFCSKKVSAQIVPDNSLNTQVNQDNSIAEITGGQTRGNNLFHSFTEFSLPDGGIASFDNAADIVKIFSRVTGGNISNIDGLIQANGSANLYLINPAGIVFGENASLDIGGSFLGSTADSILFPDGLEFSAHDTQAQPLLTINAPIGLNLGENPGQIINRAGSGLDNGGLQVGTRNSLTLVGGNIRLEGGKLTAPGGSVELGGLSDAGTVDISQDGSLSFPEEIAKANVSLTESALVNVVDAGGGSINANAQNLELSAGSLLMAGIDEAVNSSEAQAGDISLNIAEAITIDGPDSGIFNDVGMKIEGDDDVTSSAVGNAGKINIDTGSLFITSGGRIGSTIFGQGDAGNVTVNASESIEIQGFEDGKVNNDNPTGIFSNLAEEAIGDSGTISISSDSLNVNTKGQLRTSIGNNAQGTGGDIIVQTTSLTLTDHQDTEFSTSVGNRAQGTGGNIEINADTVSINSGSLITQLSEDAEGQAGNIDIKANSLTLAAPNLKEDSRPGTRSVIQTSVFQGAKGNGGNIDIETNSLSLTGIAFLVSAIREEAQGNAGNISIDTNSLSLDQDSAIRSRTFELSQGDAGAIEINANTVEINSGAKIESTTEGEGNAGSIEINASDSVLISGFSDLLLLRRIDVDDEVTEGGSSSLLTSVKEMASGQGGDIVISTPNLKILDGGLISAEVEPEAQGKGGNIFINADQLEIGDGGQIIASGLGNGDAGSITLDIAESIKIFGSDPTFSERFKAEVRIRNEEEITPDGFLTEQQGREIFSQVGIGEESQISGIFANSESQGSGGSVNIRTSSLTLEDEGRITAATKTGEGGNISLEIDDTLSMHNNTLISAKASDDASGGNVNINADFIIAFPNQIDGNGNDIIANAVVGEGGEIRINAQSLFGIEEREAIDDNRSNDIDASSTLGIDGVVDINTPKIDSTQGLKELPTAFTIPQPSEGCQANRDQDNSSFINTGRGGLPPNPYDSLDSSDILVDVQLPTEWNNELTIDSSASLPNSVPKTKQIIEANKWVVNEKGNVELVSDTSNIVANCGDRD